VKIIRIDSFSSTKGKEMARQFAQALMDPQFSPPGQHAFLGDLESWWYPTFIRTLIGMRHGRAPKAQWFAGMVWALDCEIALACRLSSNEPISGYQRATGLQPNVSDQCAFYSPGRFALDKSALTKFMEKARAGFWVGRDPDFVLYNKVGSAIFWDGRIYRTVVNNYTVQQSQFFYLTAPGNPLLPNFPQDIDPLGAGTPSNAPVGTTSAAGHAAVVPVPAPQPLIPVTNASVGEGATIAPILVPQTDQGLLLPAHTAAMDSNG
jgi:hypothetical protein